MTKPCAICKTDFDTIYHQSKICSDVCRRIYKTQKKREERKRKAEQKKKEANNVNYCKEENSNINPFFLKRGEISVTGTK